MRDESDLAGAQLYLDLGGEWALRCTGRYEFETSTFEETRLALVRDLHCWTAEISYRHYEFREDEDQIVLTFYPKAFPRTVVEAAK